VRPSARPSVTLVDCDHKQWKSAHDRIRQCIGCLLAEADLDRNIL